MVRHCWSNESYCPAIATIASLSRSLSISTLRRSHSPKCRHACALSLRGALSPPSALIRTFPRSHRLANPWWETDEIFSGSYLVARRTVGRGKPADGERMASGEGSCSVKLFRLLRSVQFECVSSKPLSRPVLSRPADHLSARGLREPGYDSTSTMRTGLERCNSKKYISIVRTWKRRSKGTDRCNHCLIA
jgi:hypothetical protein